MLRIFIYQNVNKKNGFSLIELLIVLLIISITYFLVLNKKILKYENTKIINNIRTELNKIKFNNKINIICSTEKINKDKYCLYLADDKKIKINKDLEKIFNKNLIVYKIDKYNNINELKNKRYIYKNLEYNILFNIEYNKKDIFSPYILKYKNNYYDLENPINIKKYKDIKIILKEKSKIDEF